MAQDQNHQQMNQFCAFPDYFCSDFKFEQKEFLKILHTTENESQDEKTQRVSNSQKVLGTLIYGKIDNPSDDENSQREDQIQVPQVNKRVDQYPKILKPKAKFFAKNNNMPKHLMKQSIRYYGTFGKNYFQQSQGLKKELDKFIVSEKKGYNQIKNYNNNLQSMRKIFGINKQSYDPNLRSLLFRKYTRSLIKQKIIPELYSNKQIKQMLKSYLFTLKVQVLRCCNTQLMTRTESQ